MNSLNVSPDFPCFPDNAKSLANRYLTKEIYERLIHIKTQYGFTLYDAIRSGLENPDSSIGIYAGDAESYELFSDIFIPIIQHYHSIEVLKHHIKSTTSSSFTSIITDRLDLMESRFPDPDREHKYIISTRIRVARNLNGFPFTPIISTFDRKRVEKIIIQALENIPSPLKGVYRSIQPSLIIKSSFDKSFFRKGDRFQDAAGINRDWPDSRGIFESDDKKFMVWVNEEDHLRVISIDKTGDISGVFKRLIMGVKDIENNLNLKNISFAWNQELGYLTACPSNLGTAMRASVHIKLPNLFKNKHLLNNAATQLQLQIRGTKGENSDVESAVFDISNIQRLGVTEKQCVEILYKGLCKIIELEEDLANYNPLSET
ncbi:MAG: arginine kinase [Desulfamplus sp.]|nr:arginine kinase [Desulfamplus sp.]